MFDLIRTALDVHLYFNKVLRYYLVPFFLHEYVFVHKHRTHFEELVNETEKMFYAFEYCSFVWFSAIF